MCYSVKHVHIIYLQTSFFGSYKSIVMHITNLSFFPYARICQNYLRVLSHNMIFLWQKNVLMDGTWLITNAFSLYMKRLYGKTLWYVSCIISGCWFSRHIGGPQLLSALWSGYLVDKFSISIINFKQ